MFNIAQQTYSTYENGRVLPPLEITQKLADYFNVSVDYLLGREKMPAGFPTDISQFENDLRKINFPVDEWLQLSDEQKQILLSTIENFIKNKK